MAVISALSQQVWRSFDHSKSEIKVLFSFKATKFYHDLLLKSASILYLVFELVKALPDVDHLADAPVQQKIYKRQNSLKEE